MLWTGHEDRTSQFPDRGGGGAGGRDRGAGRVAERASRHGAPQAERDGTGSVDLAGGAGSVPAVARPDPHGDAAVRLAPEAGARRDRHAPEGLRPEPRHLPAREHRALRDGDPRRHRRLRGGDLRGGRDHRQHDDGPGHPVRRAAAEEGAGDCRHDARPLRHARGAAHARRPHRRDVPQGAALRRSGQGVRGRDRRQAGEGGQPAHARRGGDLGALVDGREAAHPQDGRRARRR